MDATGTQEDRIEFVLVGGEETQFRTEIPDLRSGKKGMEHKAGENKRGKTYGRVPDRRYLEPFRRRYVGHVRLGFHGSNEAWIIRDAMIRKRNFQFQQA